MFYERRKLLWFLLIKYKARLLMRDDDGNDDDVLAHVTDPTTLANVLPNEIRPLLKTEKITSIHCDWQREGQYF